jgi:transglutaminase-like putative cysteine protease
MRGGWRLRQADPARLWLLGGLSLAFLPHLQRLPLLLILPSALLLAWRLAFELRFAALPSRLLRWLLTLLALLATFAAYHTIMGREAGVALLVIMLCLKLMEMNSGRDVAVVMGLGYFVVITVFLFDQSIFMGLYMLLVVTLLTTALSAFSRQPSPAPQWANLRTAGVMLAQAAPLTLLLFVLFPRIPGPLWNLPDEAPAAATGLANTMAPGNFSRLVNNTAVAFRVQFESAIPPPSQQYWRGLVLTRFDGRIWSNPANASRRQSFNTNLSYKALGQPVRYTVTLEPHQRYWLFALDLPAALPPGSRLSPDYELLADKPVRQLRRYTIQSYPHYQLDAFVAPTLSRYLQLPSGFAPRARRLAEEWRDQSPDPAAVVQQALHYFRDQPFYYSRTPPLLHNDPVDEFLFGSRRGYCEHYASAFAVLMRAAGIPARVVAGYEGGEVNPLGDYFMVRQSDAHAWDEVWLRGRGWVRVDPTAVIPAARIEAQADLERLAPAAAKAAAGPAWTTRLWRQLGYGWDNLNHYWNQWIIGYNDRTQTAFLSHLGLEGMDWRGMVGLLAGGLGLVLALIAARLLRQQRRAQDPVLMAYQRFCRKLARQGLSRAPAEGATAFARRARAARPDLAAAVQHITDLYQRLRYAPTAPSDGLRQLQRAVRGFKPSAKC